MSKRFYRVIIEDVANVECTENEQKALLDVFEYTIKKMATTLARKSWYVLEDYATTKQSGIEHFTLMIERKEILYLGLGQDQWHGVFEYENKRLEVIGTLEQ